MTTATMVVATAITMIGGQKFSPLPNSDPVNILRKPADVPPPGDGSTHRAAPLMMKLVASVTTMSGTLDVWTMRPTVPNRRS